MTASSYDGGGAALGSVAGAAAGADGGMLYLGSPGGDEVGTGV